MKIIDIDLKEGVRKASGIVNDKGIMNELKSFYFKASVVDGMAFVYIAGADGNQTFMSKIIADDISEDEEDISFILSAEKLTEIVKYSDDDFIFSLHEDGNFIDIHSGTASWTLPTISKDEYVEIDFTLFDEEDFTDVIDAKVLYPVLKRLQPVTASQADLNDLSKFIYLNTEYAFATDDQVITYLKFPTVDNYSFSQKEVRILIDILDQYKLTKKDTSLLDGIMSDGMDEDDESLFEFDAPVSIKKIEEDTALLFKVGDEVFTSRITYFEDQFDVQATISEVSDGVDTLVAVPRANFYKAIRRVSVSASENNIFLKYEFSNYNELEARAEGLAILHAESQTENDKAIDHVDWVHAIVKNPSVPGEPASQRPFEADDGHTFSISAIQLLRAINTLYGELVSLKFSKHSQSIMITDENSIYNTLIITM